jgi:hypothetical protein
MNYETYDDMSVNRPVTLLLKGPPGSAKTTMACQLPNPVIFSFDGNDKVIGKLNPEVRKNIRIIRPRMKDGKPISSVMVWDNFTKLLAQVCEDDSVDTIVIDSLTTLGAILENNILKSNLPTSKMEIQHWGEYTRYLNWLGGDLLMADDLDKNIVFTAHERMVTKTDKETKRETVHYQLLLSTYLRDAFDAYFTDCWRCYVKPMGQYVKYWVRTIPDDEFMAKCSLPIKKEFCWDDEKVNILPHFQRNKKPKETK